MASLHSAQVRSRKCAVECPTLPFTAVEDDPDIAPVLKVMTQLFVPVQTAAGHDKDEHVSDSNREDHRLTCHFSGGVCIPPLLPSLSF